MTRARTTFEIPLPPPGNHCGNIQFRHGGVLGPDLSGKLKSMMTPGHVRFAPTTIDGTLARLWRLRYVRRHCAAAATVGPFLAPRTTGIVLR
jgi:hypothetical protein